MGLTSTEDTAGVAQVDLGDTSPSAVDAVYTDADTKLFAIRGVICKFPEDVKVALHAENPVPLLSSDGKFIGSARVLPGEEGVIIAEGLFQYGCPERLSIEMGISHYFHPEMSENFIYSRPVTFERPTGVLVSVRRLVLSADARTDAFIEPVEPLSEEESP